MDTIPIKFLEDINKEISELTKKYGEIVEFLKGNVEKKERYTSYWELKEFSEKLKFKYRLLNSWSRINYNQEINEYLCKEIYFFENCFFMLKELFNPKYVDFQHYLKAANLEFEYFIDEDSSYPKEFINKSFDTRGIGDDPRMNLILNNIEKAQKNLNLIIENIKNKNNDEKDLFLYYEVLGDLYIHVFIILKKCGHAIEDSMEFLNQSYYYYLISYKYKEVVEKRNPTTYFDGLHGWEVFKIFVEFFNEIGAGNIHNVRLKLEFLEQNYLGNTVISKIQTEVESGFQ